MNYFFVFQNKTFNEESRGGYLWAPKHGDNNRRISHWDKMRQIKKGDIIIHSFNKSIRAISIAQSDCYSSNRPTEIIDDWNLDGWRVDTKYFFFNNYIITSDHMAELKKLQPLSDAPFNSIGRGNTGYLFDSTKEMFNYILNETVKIQDSEGEKDFVLSIANEQVIRRNRYNIPDIRIIPMSGPEEFSNKTSSEIQQDFFLNDLLSRKGCSYYYRQSGLVSENNTLLLFQVNNEIIACARLKEIRAFGELYLGKYKGAISLYPDSIQVFEPIEFEELKFICPEIIYFSQVKQKIKIEHLSDLIKLINQKSKGYKLTGLGFQITSAAAEAEAKNIDNEELLKRIKNNKAPKPKTRSTATLYYRDPYLKELVRRLADGKCQLCHKEAPFKDRSDKPYLEEHHIVQLSEGGKDYIDNVVALCPNCHTKMHIVKGENEVAALKAEAVKNMEKAEQFLN